MTVFISKINVNSEGYAKNRREMLAHIEQLQMLNARGALISEQRKSRFEARGQLTPRERLARLLDVAKSIDGPLVLAGSSFGAFISGLASLQVEARGLFLLALPLLLRGHDTKFDAARVPLAIVHGWDDELIPARAVIDYAATRRATLHLVNDAHRLTDHVVESATWFGHFLDRLPR